MRWQASTIALAAAGALAILGAGGGYAGYEYSRQQQVRSDVMSLTGGDPNAAPGLLVHYGCAACHDIPGVRGSRGQIGPPLRQIAGRVYVGGVLTNTPDNLVRWIVNPRAVNPKTAMPVTGITEPEARHVAAYLLTLR
jgi:cytochrome c2